MNAQLENPLDVNQAGLCSELDRVYRALDGDRSVNPDPDGARPATLDRICAVFGLTPFERDLLLLCAGCELEARFSERCAAANNDPRSIWPSPSLAFTALAGPHWSAIGPDGPLRYWKMIEIVPGAGLVRSPLRIAERVLHFLTGIACSDERLQGLVRRLRPDEQTKPLPYRECARRVAEYWTLESEAPRYPVLLVGRRNSDRRLVEAELCRIVHVPCFAMRASDIPAGAEDRALAARLWTRESLLTGAVLFIATRDGDAQEAGRLSAFLELVSGPVAVEVREESEIEGMEGCRIQIPSLTTGERKAVWAESLGEAAAGMNGSLDRIADYFDMDAAAIRLAGGLAKSAAARQPEADAGELAWQECRVHSRRSFEGLASRIQPRAGWDDLVLPEAQKETLRQIVAHVQQRSLVNGDWGFGERYSKGLGVTALFAGASGTGKTMAAEVLAAQLKLDLFQIDLSGVVSKYIGETEKNLRRIFDAADKSGAVLLFDEADAIFGKRSEVNHSNDRYANLEISYLLQRMEAYHGLAILTTNMKHALDAAFIRRIRFILQFPFPAAAERSRIWGKVFPSQTPLDKLDYAKIAQLNVAGGVIRNIATHAAFLAAGEGTPVGMNQILRAARVEYAKLDRAITPAETGGWT
jgi:hypothetical protein